MVPLFIDSLVQLRHFTAILVAIAALGPSGCATEDGGSPDQGPFISPALDAGRQASALIGPEGGSVEATGADGRRYTLTIPAEALIEETEIALTPITAIDDLPMSGGLVGAVHFEPSGLELFRAATLTVELASAAALGSDELLSGFVYDGDGENLTLSLVESDGSSFSLPVRHFSGAGAGAAKPSDLEAAFAAGTADAFIADVSETILAGDDDAHASIMRAWYQALVKPDLQAAVTSDAALERALAGYDHWLNSLLMLGLDLSDLSFESYELAAAALRDAIARANDTCERQQSFAQAEKALLWQRRAESVLPEAVRLANGLDRRSVVLDLCVQVAFESTSFPQVPIAGEPEPLHVVVGYAFGTGAVERAAGMELSVYAGSQIPTSASAETDASGEVELSVTPPAGTLEIEVVACIGRVPGAGMLTGALICQQAFIVRGLVVLPGIVDLAPGSSQQFVAQVLGIDEPVTWSATGGTIDANGRFTAGNTAGTFDVTATSNADASVRADASVTISGAPDTELSGSYYGEADQYEFSGGYFYRTVDFAIGIDQTGDRVIVTTLLSTPDRGIVFTGTIQNGEINAVAPVSGDERCWYYVGEEKTPCDLTATAETDELGNVQITGRLTTGYDTPGGQGTGYEWYEFVVGTLND